MNDSNPYDATQDEQRKPISSDGGTPAEHPRRIGRYELLAGRQPFRGDTQAELYEQVTSYEARPLRQYDEKLPKELERICHKAMAKRASERYSSAHDMAEDLRLFLQDQTVIHSGTSPGGITSVASSTQGSTQAATSVGSIAASSASMRLGSSDSQPRAWSVGW